MKKLNSAACFTLHGSRGSLESYYPRGDGRRTSTHFEVGRARRCAPSRTDEPHSPRRRLRCSAGRGAVPASAVLAVFCAISFFLTTGILSAATPEEAFTQANAAFIEGKYSAAVSQYEILSQQGQHSPTLYYNMGNAHFRNGKIGPAILNYERALWLRPQDADIRANLQFVRRSAALEEFPETWWSALTHTLALDGWTWLSALGLTLFCLLIIMRFFYSRWHGRLLPVMLLLLTLTAGFCAASRFRELNRAVLQSEMPLRIAPMENSASSFSLPAGAVVNLQKSRDGFVYIRAQDGKTGWVPEKQAERIVPKG